jgi:hypothetical protein
LSPPRIPESRYNKEELTTPLISYASRVYGAAAHVQSGEDGGDGKDCSEEGEMDVMPMIPLFSGVDVIPRTQTACAEPLIKLVEEAPDGVGMVYRVPRP